WWRLHTGTLPASRRNEAGLPAKKRIRPAGSGNDSALEGDREPVLAKFLARLQVVARTGRRGPAWPLDIMRIVADPVQRKRPAPGRGQIAARAVGGAEVEQMALPSSAGVHRDREGLVRQSRSFHRL